MSCFILLLVSECENRGGSLIFVVPLSYMLDKLVQLCCFHSQSQPPQQQSLKSPTVHNFPQKSRPLKPITVLFLQSVSLWVGNCFYNFITFKALAYLDSTDRILPLACSGRELMEKETIELPWRFHGRGAVALTLSRRRCFSVLPFWLLH